jgi:hypothetical protein
MNSNCDICNENREYCFKCGSRDSVNCVDCSPDYKYVENIPICIQCFDKHKCEEECKRLKIHCQKCSNSSEQYTCLEHHPRMGMCGKCWDISRCNSCKEHKVDVWSHDCGQFCTDCRKQIKVDYSPLTLSKIYPKKHGERMIAVGKYKYYCDKCLPSNIHPDQILP